VQVFRGGGGRCPGVQMFYIQRCDDPASDFSNAQLSNQAHLLQPHSRNVCAPPRMHGSAPRSSGVRRHRRTHDSRLAGWLADSTARCTGAAAFTFVRTAETDYRQPALFADGRDRTLHPRICPPVRLMV